MDGHSVGAAPHPPPPLHFLALAPSSAKLPTSYLTQDSRLERGTSTRMMLCPSPSSNSRLALRQLISSSFQARANQALHTTGGEFAGECVMDAEAISSPFKALANQALQHTGGVLRVGQCAEVSRHPAPSLQSSVALFLSGLFFTQSNTITSSLVSCITPHNNTTPQARPPAHSQEDDQHQLACVLHQLRHALEHPQDLAPAHVCTARGRQRQQRWWSQWRVSACNAWIHLTSEAADRWLVVTRPQQPEQGSVQDCRWQPVCSKDHSRKRWWSMLQYMGQAGGSLLPSALPGAEDRPSRQHPASSRQCRQAASSRHSKPTAFSQCSCPLSLETYGRTRARGPCGTPAARQRLHAAPGMGGEQ